MSQDFVAILMGSDSDWPTVEAAANVLKKFGIAHEVKIASAHRTPEQTLHYIQSAEQRGCQVFIAAAGMAAHLAGTIAAHTTKPVIGIPVDSGPLQGFDALLSTVQMPGGIPVASVAIGKAGAKNAGYLATQILAIHHPELTAALQKDRQDQQAVIMAKDAELRATLKS